jgi:hypothetical protein
VKAAIAILVVVGVGIHTVATMSLRGLVALAVIVFVWNSIWNSIEAFVK